MSTPDRTATRDAARTKEAVLQATSEIVRDRGAGFSIVEVATRAGVSKSGLLHHFPSKDELLTAVVARSITGFRQAVLDQVDLTENRPGKLVRGYIRALCGASEEAMQAIAPADQGGYLDDLPAITELLEEDATWWRDMFARDGLPLGRALAVTYAAEGVASAVQHGIYLTDDELDAVRAELLALAEPATAEG